MLPILRQASWLALAQVITRAIGFFYTIFLARNLAIEEFGLYSVGLAYFSLISTISDFGFNRFLVREIAKDHLRFPTLVFNVTFLRLTVSSCLFGIFAVILYALDPDKFRVSVSLLMVLAVVPQAVALTLDGLFIALKRLQLSALSLVFLSIFTSVIGYFLVSSGFGTTGTAVALILGQLGYLLIIILVLLTQKINLLSEINFKIIREITLGSLPYGLLGILGMLYFRIDTILLSYLKGNFDTGIYSAAYKFLEAAIFIPTALSTALFPVVAKLYLIDKSRVESVYFKSLKIMLFIGILVALGYMFILPFFIKIFLPSYSSSVDVLRILTFSLPFIFIHAPGIQVLFSTDKFLKQVIVLSVITLSFNVILNLIFIPKFGVYAAAWVTVASEILSFIIFFQLIRIKVLK
ncbi:flippase [Candidatus Daviesbacteria bacterium]|nr:flippase [Candidatus Daviesbacteria bacterium]